MQQGCIDYEKFLFLVEGSPSLLPLKSDSLCSLGMEDYFDNVLFYALKDTPQNGLQLFGLDHEINFISNTEDCL